MAGKETLGPTIVKKYGNRRLYDTGSSRYVTLAELEQLVRSGTDVRVVDAKSGEDLTQATLVQIILDSRGASNLLPVPLLNQLIRMGDDALAEFFGRYVTYALDLYLQAKQSAQAALAPLNPLATMPFSAANTIMDLWNQTTGWHAGPSSAGTAPQRTNPKPPPGPPPSGEEEVAALRRELDALKAAIEKPARKKKRKKRTR